MRCPRCEQGDVLVVRLLALERDAFLCDECDALWFERSAIGPGAFVDYATWMEAHGRPGSWSELEVISRELT